MPPTTAVETTHKPPDRKRLEKFVLLALNILATIHIVWFYIDRVPSYLKLDLYARGAERMPFQGRLLMEYPLRWAYTSPAIGHMAAWLGSFSLWLPRGVPPEDLVEFAVDVVAVGVAGLVARDLYRTHSKTRRFTAYVYPLFLVMVAGSYCLATTHFFRFVYDLPSLGLFACGLYLIAHRRHPLLFAAVFVAATLNRETSLFLLFFFLASSCLCDGTFAWRRALNLRIGGTTALLAAFWIGWHVWVTRHFAGLASEAKTHVSVNLAFLLWPMCWPQVAGVAAYTLPILLIFKSKTRTAELRLWAWIIPIWAAFMFFRGIVIEIRLLGELLPLFACMAVLLAEERLLNRNGDGVVSDEISG
jgi:hypothetical protein